MDFIFVIIVRTKLVEDDLYVHCKIIAYKHKIDHQVFSP